MFFIINHCLLELIGVYTLETLLDQLEAVDFQHEVAISHAFCLNSPNEGQRQELFKRLAKQKVQIMSTVPYDLRDRRPPIDELLASLLFVVAASTAELVARRPIQRKVMLQGNWVEQEHLVRY